MERLSRWLPAAWKRLCTRPGDPRHPVALPVGREAAGAGGGSADPRVVGLVDGDRGVGVAGADAESGLCFGVVIVHPPTLVPGVRPVPPNVHVALWARTLEPSAG
ncbi:hypothetical protein ACE1SV_52230 [Streptomyces sennicomposti]